MLKSPPEKKTFSTQLTVILWFTCRLQTVAGISNDDITQQIKELAPSAISYTTRFKENRQKELQETVLTLCSRKTMALLPLKVVQQGDPDAMPPALESGLKKVVKIPSPSKPCLTTIRCLMSLILCYQVSSEYSNCLLLGTSTGWLLKGNMQLQFSSNERWEKAIFFHDTKILFGKHHFKTLLKWTISMRDIYILHIGSKMPWLTKLV